MSWETAKLGDVTEVSRGTTITKKQTVHGNIPVIGGGMKPTYFHNEFNRDAGVITISGSGASAGFVNYWEEPIFASDCSTVQPFDKSYDKKFLYFFLLSQQQFIYENFRSGTAQPHVYAKDIATLDIPKIDLTAQKRIVEKLDTAFTDIDKAISAAERNIENAEALYAKKLDEYFDEIISSPSNKKLKEITTRLTNGYVGATRNIYQEHGIPYLLAKNVKDNILTFDKKAFVSEEFNQKNKKSILKEDDVLLVQSGHIGHSAVVPKEHEGHNCHAMIVISTDKLLLSGMFLSLFFQTNIMKQKFREIRTGSTVPHLNCKDVRELSIPLVDVDTQNQIVQHFKVLNEYFHSLINTYEKKVANLAALRSSILNQAFSGELTKDTA